MSALAVGRRAALPYLAVVAGVVSLLAAPAVRAEGPAGDAPSWQPLLAGKVSAAEHLRRAEAHGRRGRCGAAIFHWRQAIAASRAGWIRRRLQGRIDACLRRQKWRGKVVRSPPRIAGIGSPLSAEVHITAGEFLVGSTRAERRQAAAYCLEIAPGSAWCRADLFDVELKRSRRRLPAFWIDRTEVTRGAYDACVRAGRCARLSGKPVTRADVDLPVTGLTAAEAARYCRFRGKRLPTEAEWEKAARGPAVPPRVWPWGRFSARSCGVFARGGRAGPGAPAAAPGRVRKVGTTPCDASPYGVLDLGGNVREWSTPVRSSTKRVIKGGSYSTPAVTGRVAGRSLVTAGKRAADIGFRCAR